MICPIALQNCSGPHQEVIGNSLVILLMILKHVCNSNCCRHLRLQNYNFFGGDEVSVASPSPFLEPGHAWPEPAETSDKQTRPDVLLSKSECNRLLFEARMSSMGDAGMKLPWEQGVWERIFADYDDDVFQL